MVQLISLEKKPNCKIMYIFYKKNSIILSKGGPILSAGAVIMGQCISLLFIGVTIPELRTRPQHLYGSSQPELHTVPSSQTEFWSGRCQEPHPFPH